MINFSLFLEICCSVGQINVSIATLFPILCKQYSSTKMHRIFDLLRNKSHNNNMLNVVGKATKSTVASAHCLCK